MPPLQPLLFSRLHLCSTTATHSVSLPTVDPTTKNSFSLLPVDPTNGTVADAVVPILRRRDDKANRLIRHKLDLLGGVCHHLCQESNRILHRPRRRHFVV